LYGGPEHNARAAAALTSLHRLCNETELGPMPLTLIDLHCVLTGLQQGDVTKAARALERWELRHKDLEGEMRWHHERMRALVMINLDQEREGRSALVALHRRSSCCEMRGGIALFCAYDQHMLFSPGKLDPALQRALAPAAFDPPNIWAHKLRALETAGALDDARSALELLPAGRLRALPCDREFLGTMGALARTALRLQAQAYIRVIYERLVPYPEHFAVGLFGLCEGSVSLLLGLLAWAGGDKRRASDHFDTAVLCSDRAGFARSAAEARTARERFA
jgi:hypothetical protein